MNLCQYKNMFGEPGKGVHSYRLFKLAIVDVVMTIIGAYLISKYFKNVFCQISINFFITIFCYTIRLLFLLIAYYNRLTY